MRALSVSFTEPHLNEHIPPGFREHASYLAGWALPNQEAGKRYKSADEDDLKCNKHQTPKSGKRHARNRPVLSSSLLERTVQRGKNRFRARCIVHQTANTNLNFYHINRTAKLKLYRPKKLIFIFFPSFILVLL